MLEKENQTADKLIGVCGEQEEKTIARALCIIWSQAMPRFLDLVNRVWGTPDSAPLAVNGTHTGEDGNLCKPRPFTEPRVHTRIPLNPISAVVLNLN